VLVPSPRRPLSARGAIHHEKPNRTRSPSGRIVLDGHVCTGRIPKWQLRRSSPHGEHEPVWVPLTGKMNLGVSYVANRSRSLWWKTGFANVANRLSAASTATGIVRGYVKAGIQPKGYVARDHPRLDRRAGQIQAHTRHFPAAKAMSSLPTMRAQSSE